MPFFVVIAQFQNPASKNETPPLYIILTTITIIIISSCI